jgi:predicted RNA-binding protein YlqC (UPF0109 family)
MSQPIKLDAVETAIHMIAMLTSDKRVDVDIIFPDQGSPLIEITTTNESYGRVSGSGGKTINDLRVLMDALLEGANVILKVANDNIKVNRDIYKITATALLDEFISNCDSLVGVEVTHSSSAVVLKQAHGIQIDGDLKVAIERVFFAISRAQGERLPVRWS